VYWPPSRAEKQTKSGKDRGACTPKRNSTRGVKESSKKKRGVQRAKRTKRGSISLKVQLVEEKKIVEGKVCIKKGAKWSALIRAPAKGGARTLLNLLPGWILVTGIEKRAKKPRTEEETNRII